jgi:multiple sugar transport system ATP-binding protein
MKIVLQHLTKKFPNRNKKQGGDVIAVNDFDFEIPDGKLVGLLGPSGCGKSTTLNLISGLEKPTEGKVFFGEDDVTGLPAQDRGVGLVFQSYALYPHLTVEKNIRFPLENLRGDAKLSKEEMAERVLHAAKLVQIDELMERKPSELSGGQQQRVAIARALSSRPSIILADEPTGNLDSKTGQDVLSLLKVSAQKYSQTLVMITHNEEIAQLADRIIRIEDGRIVS